jgi:hypothetical protein
MSYDSKWPEGEPDEELAELIGWGWKHVPGLVIGWGITHKDSMLDAIRSARSETENT